MSKPSKTLLQTLTVLISLLCLWGAGPTSAQASKATGYSSHFPTRRITYRIRSTSQKYKKSWNRAIKNWNKLHVVSLVKAPAGTQSQIGLSTKATCGKYFGYSNYTDVDDNGTPAGIDLYLSRHFVRDWYLDSSDCAALCTSLLGGALGLKTTHSLNSIMNTGSMMPDTPTKADKKGLQNAYRGVPWN